MKGGKTHIAFVEDPTGYKFELIQREKESMEPFAQVLASACTSWGPFQASRFASEAMLQPVANDIQFFFCKKRCVQVMLRVSNLEASIKYYEECLGMKLIRTRENPGAAIRHLPPASLQLNSELRMHACLTMCCMLVFQTDGGFLAAHSARVYTVVIHFSSCFWELCEPVVYVRIERSDRRMQLCIFWPPGPLLLD